MLKAINNQELLDLCVESMDNYDFCFRPSKTAGVWEGELVEKATSETVQSCLGDEADKVQATLRDLYTFHIMEINEVELRDSVEGFM